MGVTRIQHNLSAMNAMSNYQGNSGRLTNNLEKLSSGYRINSAADDAAGLAISEKMRSQIAGLEKAQDNANDGISLIQTAEGALTEVNSMLTRLKTLATQSANGTYEDGVDRANLQEETDALLEEIDRISQSTNFNGINLLDGSLSGSGSASKTGGSTAVVISNVAALNTGKSVGNPQDGVYSVDLSGVVKTVVDGSGNVSNYSITGNVKFNVTFVDAGGNEQTVELYTASISKGTSDSVATAIRTAIDNSEDLNKLFQTAGGSGSSVKLTAKSNTGTNGAQLKSINVVSYGTFSSATGVYTASANSATNISAKSYNAEVVTAPRDAETADVITFTGANTFSGGETVTVGDKTYEFVATNGDTNGVAKGNIAVNIGSSESGTLQNFVEALKANGVTSASYTGSGGDVKIGNLDEIKASDPRADISTSNKTDGVVISQQKPVKAVSEFTVSVGSGRKSSIELEYINEQGETKKLSIGYDSKTTKNGNAQEIRSKLSANDELKSLFNVTESNGVVKFTAKHAGAGGAVLKSVSTTDVDSKSVDNLQQTAVGRDAGQSISLDVNNITSGDTLSINGRTFEFVTSDKLDSVGKGNIAVLLDKDSNEKTSQNLNLAFQQNGIKADFDTGTNSFYIANGTTGKSTGGLVLQVGDTNDDFQKVSVQIDDMSSKGLGLTGLDISSQDKAGEAVDTIAAAVNKVSMQRGKLGALQNRLDHTLNNLDATTQNITAAESQIRDVDMAKEMTQYSKNNILVQAAQSMLAQANSLPQGVLSLLQ